MGDIIEVRYVMKEFPKRGILVQYELFSADKPLDESGLKHPEDFLITLSNLTRQYEKVLVKGQIVIE